MKYEQPHIKYSVKNEVKDIRLKVKKITVLKLKTFGTLSEGSEYV
jgi:hypothetical protein